MPRQIAITGNVIARPGEAERQQCETALRELGRALAAAGYHIVVYSSTAQFADPHVVSGYVASQQAKPSSIHVKYPSDDPVIAFPERQTHSAIFDMQPDSSTNWEVSFFDSLSQVDGILMIGGGRSTLVAGLVGIGYGTVVLPITSFGGYTQKIWSDLKAKGNSSLLTPPELALLATPDWANDTPAKIVSLFEACFARLEQRETDRQIAFAKAARSTRHQASLAVVLFLLCASAILVAITAGPLPASALVSILAIGAPLAGISGATIRTLHELNQRRIAETAQPAYIRAALGLVAGVFSALLLAVPQISHEPSLPPEVKIETRQKEDMRNDRIKESIPPALFAAFISGFLLDQFYLKLSHLEVKDVELKA